MITRGIPGMHRIRTRRFSFVIFLASIWFGPVSVQAEGWFYLDPLSLEVEIRFDGHFNRQATSSNENFDAHTLLLEERVPVEQSGFVVDPRITNFSVKLSPVFRQGREKQDDAEDSFNGHDLDYDIAINVLDGALAPVSAYIGTYRQTNTNDLAFGSRALADNSNSRVGMMWKNSWLPLNLEFRDETLNHEQIRFDGARFIRDEDRKIYKVGGRNQRISFNAERMEIDDNVTENEYEISNFNLSHNIRWGRRSLLNSTFMINDRTGSLESRIVNWNERLQIQHTENLESRTLYRFNSQEANDQSESHLGEFELTHHLYSNLDSSAGGGMQSLTSDVQDETRYNVLARAHYNKEFSFGRVALSANVNYENVDRESKLGLGEVVDERHIASFIEPVTLRRQFVVQSTIFVKATDGFQYDEGIDYEVLLLGGVYTQLRIIPTGRIVEGQVLLVSYRYVVQPSSEYDALFTTYNIDFNYKWLRFYHRGSNNNFSLISGFNLLADQSLQTTGLELAWQFERGRLRLFTESIKREQGGLTSKTLSMSQTFGFALANNLTMNLGSSQIFTESDGLVFDNPLFDPNDRVSVSEQDYLTLDASLNWTPRPNVGILPSIGVWKRKEDRTQGGVETNIDNQYFSARLRITWWFRKLTVDFYADHNIIDEINNDKERNRLFVSVKRRFR